jgi:uncharacterized protein DUF5522
MNSPESMVEGEDYYWEEDAMVFTERYHLRRGYCCESGCRHCPFKEAASRKPATLERSSEGKTCSC